MFDVTRYATAAQSIVRPAAFYDRGWCPPPTVIIRLVSMATVAITVSGRHKGQLGAGDVMVVDLHGQAVQAIAARRQKPFCTR